MTETAKAYIAGFFDGEGCFTIGRLKNKNRAGLDSFCITASVRNTVKAPLLYIQELFGGTIHETPARGNFKKQYSLSIRRKGIEKLVEAIRPYLLIKRDVADLVASFPTRNGISLGKGKGAITNVEAYEKQELIVAQVRKLNKKGNK